MHNQKTEDQPPNTEHRTLNTSPSSPVPAHIRPYHGRFPRIDHPLMRAAYMESVTVSGWFYGPGTADWDQKAGQVVLNSETAPYLYTDFTPLTLKYQPGSRPELDAVVARLVQPGMTERQKVFAILAYAYGGFRQDYPQALPEKILHMNAIEEEILRLNGGQCEDRSRLICCLCQIAGFPARFVASYEYYEPDEGYRTHGGHAIVEIYLEDGWAFFDSCWGFYCFKPDGRVASLWEILQDPGLVARQKDEVCNDFGRDRKWYAWYQKEYLCASRQVITLTNYAAWNFARYAWVQRQHDCRAGSADHERVKTERQALHRKLLEEIGI